MVNVSRATPWYDPRLRLLLETTGSRPFTANVTNDSADSDEEKPTLSTAQTETHGPTPNSNLKRNIDDLEYEIYETPSAPSSPGTSL